MITRVCKECSKDFEVYPSLVKKGGGKFCSQNCRSIAHSRNCSGKNHPNWQGGKIKRICAICGKSFEVKQNVVRKSFGFCCSLRCASILRGNNQKGDVNPSWKGGRVKRVCRNCGAVFMVKRNVVKSGQGLYCSSSCSYIARSGVNSPYHIPRIKRTCKTCGKEFEVLPSIIAKGNGKFCSQSCCAKGRRRSKPKKTQPEIIFEDICKKYTLPFRFVGDGALWLGNANPDFRHTTRKLVCEVFGDFWHSPLLRRNLRYNETLEGRRKQLKAEGYKLIVFWESDLKRTDAEQFVLYTLEKHNIFPSST